MVFAMVGGLENDSTSAPVDENTYRGDRRPEPV
jgi:hypothetical protein